MSRHDYLILGPQGSGKGTQAQALAGRLGIPHISTGDIFRQVGNSGSEFGQEISNLIKAGNLVPDDITNKLVTDRLSQVDTSSGFVLDGYPRNLNQAEYLMAIKPNLVAVYLNLSDNEAINRLAQRRICSVCDKVYHLQFNPPKVGEVCDLDSSHLIQRADDIPEAIKVRLQTFHIQTEPLLEFYNQRGKLIKIDGSPAIAEVTKEICQRLKL